MDSENMTPEELAELENEHVINVKDDTDITDDKLLAFDFPTFSSKNFYGLAGEIADQACIKSEADPMAVYMSSLVTCAASLGRDKYLQIGESRHYARLNACLVGSSSRARKGTSFKPVKRINQLAEQLYNAMNPYNTKTLHIAEGGLSSAEGLIYAVRDKSEEVKGKDNIPVWDGVTDKRLLVIEEEFANVLKQCQREGNTLSPTMRRAWDGGTLAPMTKNNKLTATDPHINLLAHITQFELKCLMSQADIHNGLSNRVLWACVRRSQKRPFLSRCTR